MMPGESDLILEIVDETPIVIELVQTGPAGATGGVTSVNGRDGVVVLTAADVNLGNVNNTSDANKPISTATQVALDTKLESVQAGTNVTVDDTDPLNPILSASGGGGGGAVDSVNGQTGTVVLDQDDIGDGVTYKRYSATEKTKLAGIEAGADVTDATNVGAAGAFMKLVDDTDDITMGTTNKFATAAEKTKLGFVTVTQAVDLDTMEGDIAAKQPLDSDLTAIAGLDSSTSGAIASDGAGWIKKTYAQLKTALGLVKGDVGLGNVDNTSDANKPVSTAQQTALDGKVSDTGDTMTGTLTITGAGANIDSGSSTLVVDSTNHRVGILNASPQQALDVTGQVASSSFFRTNSGLTNNSSGNNATIRPQTTGTLIDRNIADGNPVLTAQQLHASSTGDILRLKNSSATPLVVDVNGQVILASTSTSHSLKITPAASTSGSTTTGGAILLDNTANDGSGLLLYTNHAGSATGRVVDINVVNPAFNRAGFHIDYAGTANVAEISNTGTGTSNQALNVVSTNPGDTTLGVSGVETSRGTIKATHTGTGSDSSASALSLRANGTGTAAQGIFFDAEDGGTTGALQKFRNAGVDRWVIDSTGTVTTGIWGGTPVPVANGGTGATSAGTARTNLGLGALATLATVGTLQIDNDAVTYAKLQDISSTSRVLGRITAGSGDAEELTAANLKTILALTPSDVSLGNLTNDAQIKSADFPSSSVDSEIALFSSTTGKVIKRASTTGMLKGASGVLSAATEGTDYWKPGGTDVAIADGGTGASTAATAFSNLKQDASTSATGVVELATTAETDTGTDTTRAVTPDGLSGSIYGTKVVSIQVIDGATALTTGDGKAYFRIPTALNGMDLVSCGISVIAKSTSGTPTVRLERGRQANATTAHAFVNMLTTSITIDANEFDSKDATTAPVIDTSNDDVLTGDLIRVDVTTAGTGATGLFVTCAFRTS